MLVLLSQVPLPPSRSGPGYHLSLIALCQWFKLFPKAQAVWTQQPHLSQSIQSIWLAVTPLSSCLSHNLHRVSSSEFDSLLSTQNHAGSCLVHMGLWLVPGWKISNNYIISRSVAEEGREGTTESWKGKHKTDKKGKEKEECKTTKQKSMGFQRKTE